jgi:hypothetical protein
MQRLDEFHLHTITLTDRHFDFPGAGGHMRDISLQTPIYSTTFPLLPSGLFLTSRENIGILRVIVQFENGSIGAFNVSSKNGIFHTQFRSKPALSVVEACRRIFSIMAASSINPTIRIVPPHGSLR